MTKGENCQMKNSTFVFYVFLVIFTSFMVSLFSQQFTIAYYFGIGLVITPFVMLGMSIRERIDSEIGVYVSCRKQAINNGSES